jgi:hypothetical protein
MAKGESLPSWWDGEEKTITVTTPLPPDFEWTEEAEAFIRAQLEQAILEHSAKGIAEWLGLGEALKE